MEGEAKFSAIAPTIFDGTNYQMWAIRMETYMEALDHWEAMEEDYEVPALLANPTTKVHKERRTRKSKAKACLFVVVTPTIFTWIMSLKSAKAIWDYLKKEYAEDERIKGMQILNLVRKFELQKMKESESVKEYIDKLLEIANRVRLLGSEFIDSGIVEKILVTVPKSMKQSLSHPQPPPKQMKGARNYTGTLYLFFQTLVDLSLITESTYHIQRYKIKLPP